MAEQVNDADKEGTNSEEVLDLEDTTLDGTEDVDALKIKLAKAEEAKKQIHARAVRAEKEAKALKNAPPVNKEQSSFNDEIVDLRLDGYTKEDVAFIMKNGGRKALEDKNSLVSIAINAKREQAKAEAAANKVEDKSGMTDVERKYTPEQLNAMSAAELAKILPHAS